MASEPYWAEAPSRKYLHSFDGIHRYGRQIGLRFAPARRGLNIYKGTGVLSFSIYKYQRAAWAYVPDLIRVA